MGTVLAPPAHAPPLERWIGDGDAAVAFLNAGLRTAVLHASYIRGTAAAARTSVRAAPAAAAAKPAAAAAATATETAATRTTRTALPFDTVCGGLRVAIVATLRAAAGLGRPLPRAITGTHSAG